MQPRKLGGFPSPPVTPAVPSPPAPTGTATLRPPGWAGPSGCEASDVPPCLSPVSPRGLSPPRFVPCVPPPPLFQIPFMVGVVRETFFLCLGDMARPDCEGRGGDTHVSGGVGGTWGYPEALGVPPQDPSPWQQHLPSAGGWAVGPHRSLRGGVSVVGRGGVGGEGGGQRWVWGAGPHPAPPA